MCTSWKLVVYMHSNIAEALANALKCLGYQSVSVVAISTKQFYLLICSQYRLTMCLWPVFRNVVVVSQIMHFPKGGIDCDEVGWVETAFRPSSAGATPALPARPTTTIHSSSFTPISSQPSQYTVYISCVLLTVSTSALTNTSKMEQALLPISHI